MKTNLVSFPGVRLFAFFLMLIFMYSCQEEEKDPSPEKYFIKASINNTFVEFEDQGSIGATLTQYGNQHELGIFGNIEEISGILIQVYDNEAFMVGYYSGLVQAGDHLEGVRFSYVDGLENYLTDTENPVGSVEIILLNDTVARGYFSGVLKHSTSEETINISNGEFYVRVSN